MYISTLVLSALWCPPISQLPSNISSMSLADMKQKTTLKRKDKVALGGEVFPPPSKNLTRLKSFIKKTN